VWRRNGTMAWTNLTSGSQGSLVKASDVGRWLTTA